MWSGLTIKHTNTRVDGWHVLCIPYTDVYPSVSVTPASGVATKEVRLLVDRWVRARDIGLTILIWIALVIVIAWIIGHVVTAFLIFVLAALIAYALLPGVSLLQRWMPRFLAITIVYLLAIAIIGGVVYLIANTAIPQLISFAKNLPNLLSPSSSGHTNPIARLLKPLGVSDPQFNAIRDQIISRVEGSAGQIANSALPIITTIGGGLVDAILVIILSIYLVADGPRLARGLRNAAPNAQRSRVVFFINILQRTVGGYIRGQLIMSTFIGALVGGGMFAFGVPYALLLGVLGFFMEFIPIIGAILSGVACVLVALVAKSFLTALLVFGYFIIVHILEGDVVGPRVTGRVLGLHPAVAILALVGGSELFGIWGAIFAAPVVGLVQSILVAGWREWRDMHPEQFRRPPTPQPEQQEPNPQREPTASHSGD